MMIEEFIQRTGYIPTFEEYEYIEQSYYDFEGNKDEFCKQWKKDNKSGHWDKELKLRMAIDEQKKSYQKKIDEINDYLDFYRPYFNQTKDLKAEIEKLQAEIKELKKNNERSYNFIFDMIA